MDEVAELPQRVGFKVYGRVLEWGFPMGVGDRYLSQPQCVLLLRLPGMAPAVHEGRMRAILDAAGSKVE
jgi:hypothetical protein